MIQRNFKLALTAGRTIPLVIPASQYDSGEQWIFTLIDETGAKYTPATGAIIGLKSDKTAILNAGTVDAAGRVVINETEQMTAAVGKNVYEILIDDQTHGSANFIVMVEPRPGDNADFSDSDLSLLQQAIDGTSETAIKAGVQEWMNENLTDPTDPIVDASLSLSGAAADAKKTGDEISDLKSHLNNSGTLVTGGDLIPSLEQGTIVINNSGWTYGNSNVVVRTKQGTTLKLFPNDKISLSDYTNYKFYVGWRLSDGTYRAVSSWQTSDFVVATEADYVFVVRRIVDADLPVSTVESILSITRGSFAFGEIDALKTSVNTLTEEVATFDARVDIVEDILSEIPTTHDVSASDITIHDNVYIFTSGSESSATTLWQYGEYTIPLSATSLTVTATAGQSSRLWILKDGNGTVVGYSGDSSAPSKKTETIDLADYPTAKTLFVNDRKSGNLAISYTYNKKVVNGEDVYVNGESLPSVLAVSSDKLYGKVLCCCGDSITYGADMDAEGITNESNITVYNCNASGDFTETTSNFLKTWGWQIASRHNMTFYNGGVSGSTMQGEGGVNGFSLANGRYTKLPDNIDYLLVWFGWNDNAYGTLGAITDDTNASYYGGYNVVLPYLINKYPYAKIGLIVPFGASAGHREAIRLLGNKWGVAVWDNYQGGTPLYYGKEDSVGVNASIVTANRAKFQANGAHPNFKGHRQLADMIEEWLKGI